MSVSIDADRPSSTGQLTMWVRYALIAVAWLFAAGAIVQVFLAGLAVFDPQAGRWDDHVDMGRMIGFLTYLLPILALIGRVGRQRVVHAFVVTILFFVQSFLANIDEGWIAAFHAVNAFFLVGASFSLGMRTLELVRSER